MDDLNYTNNTDGQNESANSTPSETVQSYTDYSQNHGNNQPYQQYDPMNGQQPQGGKGMATASMVLGIVAIVGACCCTYVGIICGVIAVILGIISKKQQREGASMALAGIICGAIGGVIGLVTMIINFVNIANGNNPLQNILDSLSSAAFFILK